MKLKPRTTYENNRGVYVSIAGLTGVTHKGQRLYWSIQGDHYSEDGRRVSWAKGNVDAIALEDMNLHRVLLPATAGDSIKREVTTREAREWWNGVITEKTGRCSVLHT